MNRRLIITADDYGMCDSVNRAIDACLAAGATRATCVMANMPACGAVTVLRDRFPQASIGIHWTLTQGLPVLPVARIPGLVGANDRFCSFSQLRRRWLTKQVTEAEVKAELCAQYERFHEIGGAPDFWNTHEGVHVSPGLFQVFVALGLELGIAAMRCHRRITVPRDNTPTRYSLRHPLFWLKGRVIAKWSRRAEAQGMLMPDGIVHTPGYAVSQATVEEILQRLPWSSVSRAVELTIHPALTVEEKLFGNLTESRVREYQVFSDPELVEQLCEMGVVATCFQELGK